MDIETATAVSHPAFPSIDVLPTLLLYKCAAGGKGERRGKGEKGEKGDRKGREEKGGKGKDKGDKTSRRRQCAFFF